MCKFATAGVEILELNFNLKINIIFIVEKNTFEKLSVKPVYFVYE